MNYKIKNIILILIALILLSIVVWPVKAQTIENNQVATSTEPVATSTGPVLSLPQELWLASLEYCESRGIPTAVNWHDRDGTPSYYSFQFKPSSFKGFGIQYGVIKKGLSDSEYMELMKRRDLQKLIVSYMILDPSIKWYIQFPDCTKKFGRPPQY